jgi:type I restriction enzyme S subunit
MTLYGRRTTIGDLINEVGGEVKTGPFGTALKASEYTTTGVPVISVGEIGHGEFHIHDRTPYVDESVTTRLPQFLLEIGDIVFARKGSVERSALVGHRQQGWFLGSDGIRLRLSDAVDSRFVRYWISSEETKHWLVQNSTGSTMASLNQATIKRLPIVLPSLAEQREIASILGALDDKIELNRRMSATLEDMARSLYRSWFVDFDPVNAKMEGRQPAFMDEATSALFPERFVDDGLPEGWKLQAIGDHFHAVKGLSYKGAGLCSEAEGLPLHNLNSVLEGGGYKYSGIKYYSGDYRERHTVRPGDLIVANTEQGFDHMLIGHSAIVPRNFGPMGLFSHHLFKVEPKSRSWLSREWLYLTLSVSPTGTVVRSFSNGTTVNMLPADAFEIPQIIVPAEAVVDRFNDLISPWFDRRGEAINQASTLASLRDSLLPKLMSGEIRLGEAREQVEEVA